MFWPRHQSHPTAVWVESQGLTKTSRDGHGTVLRLYSIWPNLESGFGFTGKLNGLDSWVSSEVTWLLFVYVCNTDVTSGFASKSMSKLDSLGSRIWIRALNGRIHWIWKLWIWIQVCQIEYSISGTVATDSLSTVPGLSWQVLVTTESQVSCSSFCCSV